MNPRPMPDVDNQTQGDVIHPAPAPTIAPTPEIIRAFSQKVDQTIGELGEFARMVGEHTRNLQEWKQNCLSDEFDATDAACPAWWRGQEYGADAMLGEVRKWLEEEEMAGVYNPHAQKVREAIHALRKDRSLASKAIDILQKEKDELVRHLVMQANNPHNPRHWDRIVQWWQENVRKTGERMLPNPIQTLIDLLARQNDELNARDIGIAGLHANLQHLRTLMEQVGVVIEEKDGEPVARVPQIEALEIELSEVRDMSTHHWNNYSETLRQLEEKRKECERLQDEVQALNEAVTYYRLNYENASAKHVEERNACDELRGEVQALKEKLQDAEGKVTGKAIQAASLHERVDDLEQELNVVRGAYLNTLQENAALRNRVSALEVMHTPIGGVLNTPPPPPRAPERPPRKFPKPIALGVDMAGPEGASAYTILEHNPVTGKYRVLATGRIVQSDVKFKAYNPPVCPKCRTAHDKREDNHCDDCGAYWPTQGGE